MSTFNPADFQSLSVSDRLTLVEAIWDSIADEQECLPLTDEQRAELDRRIADMDANPNSGLTWDEVKARIRSKS